MGNLLSTRNNTDLINSSNLGTQATMDAEKLSVNYGSENKEVEDVAARLPYGCVAVFLLAFFVETVHLCDLTRFVISSDENNAIWVSIRRQYALDLAKQKEEKKGKKKFVHPTLGKEP